MAGCRASQLLTTVSLAILSVPCLGTAQRAPAIQLSPSTAVSRGTFTGVRSVRELHDGRVLVADRSERRLYIIQLDSPEKTVIGREGSGPGEYRGIGWLYSLSPDSTLFTDSYDGRWNLLTGSEIVETLSQYESLVGLLSARVSGTDHFGHVLGVSGHGFSGPQRRRASADSLVLILAERSTGAADTLAVIRGRGEFPVHRQPAEGNRPTMLIGGNPLASEDQALLFPDGWIAVARVSPYRVDWRSPDGRWHRGAALPHEQVRTDDREKCAALNRWIGGLRDCDPSILEPWPEVVPAFVPSRERPDLFATPDGRLVIARTPTARFPGHRYDVVDRDGALTGVITLPENEVLIGFGSNSVYILVTDELDLQRLRRHPWP